MKSNESAKIPLGHAKNIHDLNDNTLKNVSGGGRGGGRVKENDGEVTLTRIDNPHEVAAYQEMGYKVVSQYGDKFVVNIS